MGIPLYLSMTAAEFAGCLKFPDHMAWMACHFSPYSTGLTNLPARLPKGAILILNDRTTIHGHDPKQVRQMLADTAAAFACSGVLLDLQQPDNPEAREIIREVLTLPCPVCVSDIYAKELDCPVFLPPVPLTVSPKDHFAPWQGREIWLEAAEDSTVFTVDKDGCHSKTHPPSENFPFRDAPLCCHYRIESQEDCIRFYLRRTKEDLADLLALSAAFGVTTGVGLWQELGK